ncbi:MAG: hypothetical protein GF349_00390 [Candidatus Magasanikbacteria bacterium]|nr:hypothetical protein [Candidatus Magasanikbacteria bacterium]
MQKKKRGKALSFVIWFIFLATLALNLIMLCPLVYDELKLNWGIYASVLITGLILQLVDNYLDKFATKKITGFEDNQ